MSVDCQKMMEAYANAVGAAASTDLAVARVHAALLQKDWRAAETAAQVAVIHFEVQLDALKTLHRVAAES
jgi:hypothetical protein